MTNPPPGTDGGSDRMKDRLPEADLGGADAVEKTTYVVGDGTGPESRPSRRYTAPDTERAGGGVAVWAIVSVAALIALVYAIGIFR